MRKEYLQEGPLSKFTPIVKDFAKDIEGEGLDLMFNIHYKVAGELGPRNEPWKTREERSEYLHREHQKRTAEDILKSDYTYGCDEFGILIATIARLKGIPTKYIQCSDLIPYLKKQGLPGHVYLEFYLNSGTYLMDSTKGVMIKIHHDKEKQNLYRSRSHKQMVEAAFGLDPNDAGIFSHEDLIKLLEKTNIEYVEMTGFTLNDQNPNYPPKPEFLYHGSYVGGIKTLEPRRNTSPGVLGSGAPSAVYATDIISYACAFGFPWSSREGFELGFNEDKVELGVPKQYKDRIEDPLYVYVVKSEYFELLPEASPEGHNYWSHESVPVEKIIEYKSVKDALEELGCKIYYI